MSSRHYQNIQWTSNNHRYENWGYRLDDRNELHNRTYPRKRQVVNIIITRDASEYQSIKQMKTAIWKLEKTKKEQLNVIQVAEGIIIKTDSKITELRNMIRKTREEDALILSNFEEFAAHQPNPNNNRNQENDDDDDAKSNSLPAQSSTSSFNGKRKHSAPEVMEATKRNKVD